ncbi:MAG TPA: DUF4321 domain-containing protein [Syntrophomonadaceae bacterium]|nr:DUF4321 domain-containing protein [Syntrophomonadaceae bacterium]
MKGYGQYRSPWLLVILLVLGGIFGGLIGQALGSIPALAFLREGRSIGLPVTTLNLDVLAFTFGFTFKANLISLLGFIAAFAIYRRL